MQALHMTWKIPFLHKVGLALVDTPCWGFLANAYVCITLFYSRYTAVALCQMLGKLFVPLCADDMAVFLTLTESVLQKKGSLMPIQRMKSVNMMKHVAYVTKQMMWTCYYVMAVQKCSTCLAWA